MTKRIQAVRIIPAKIRNIRRFPDIPDGRQVHAAHFNILVRYNGIADSHVTSLDFFNDLRSVQGIFRNRFYGNAPFGILIFKWTGFGGPDNRFISKLFGNFAHTKQTAWSSGINHFRRDKENPAFDFRKICGFFQCQIRFIFLCKPFSLKERSKLVNCGVKRCGENVIFKILIHFIAVFFIFDRPAKRIEGNIGRNPEVIAESFRILHINVCKSQDPFLHSLNLIHIGRSMIRIDKHGIPFLIQIIPDQRMVRGSKHILNRHMKQVLILCRFVSRHKFSGNIHIGEWRIYERIHFPGCHAADQCARPAGAK